MSLQADNLAIQFGGVHALQGVSIEIVYGRVTGVVGPNGAGKTTVFNCLTGFVAPDSGRVFLDGNDISGLPPHKRARAGLARAFQTPRVDLEATVLDAAALGCYVEYRPSLAGSLLGLPAVRRREREVERRTRAALDRVGLGQHADREVGELSLAHLRLLEVARATVANPRFVLLDEPAAGLGPVDRRRLADTLRSLVDDGVGVMLIEHNLDFVASVSDTVFVLHRGGLLFHGGPQEFRESPAVREAYVGGGPTPEPTGSVS